jgi:hypothetical protein
MMATLTINITGTHAADVARSSIIPAQLSVTVANSLSSGRLTVTESASLAVPLGNAGTARYLYAVNQDATNYIVILDDAIEIARLLAGDTCFIPLPSGVVLKAQANTANCTMDFAVYGAA